MLAPRVNAAGRMSTPDLATRLLLASDETRADEARSLAAQLDTENTKRQQEEAAILEAARRRIEADPDIAAHNILVVWGEGWHRGIIGLVASKLVETFHRPAIVLTIEGDLAHGSGRSIPPYDLLAALQQCATLFVRFGGHRQAAGLTIEAARLKEFQMRIIEHADGALSPADLIPRLPIDGLLPFGAITGRVIEDLGALEPFGSGNRRPVFHARDVEVVDGPRILKDRHLRFSIRHQGRTFAAIMWRGADRASFFEQHRRGLNLAFSLAENQYQGERFVQLSVADAAEDR
jgi:single-stranded-DNA-specific exonuclease